MRNRATCRQAPGGTWRVISCSTMRFEDGMINPTRAVMDMWSRACRWKRGAGPWVPVAHQDAPSVTVAQDGGVADGAAYAFTAMRGRARPQCYTDRASCDVTYE